MSSQLASVDSAYAQRRKQHLALINQLRAIGAQADLDLPRIAVIGNQSAGKSSLVEAISGISVPRDAGTCTRCPMECRLSHSSGKWRCQVSIRWEFNPDGSRMEEVQEIPFGSVITSKADVELALRRAQAAVLNPKRSASKYLMATADQLKALGTNQLKFSRNTVCVDLQGPDLTDLAFVDLPGIIQNAESDTVNLVEELVLSHIRGNCLILVTLPMSDDIENQKAARLARQEDPKGLRTIGVLTKPDTLTAGATKARDLWLDVIEGRRFPLRHGYYCTRQPDDDERTNGITPEQARTAEQAFFSKTIPWSKSTHQHRFGTNNLISSVSKLLTQIIDETLPKLQSETNRQLEKCVTRLFALPQPITAEPSSYILSLITSFCQDVRLNVHGDPDCAELVQANRKTYITLKHDIRSSAPQFLPFVDKSEMSANAVNFLGVEDDSDDDEDGITTVDLRPGSYVFLQDIKRHIEQSMTRELPNNIPYPAKVSLIQASQSTWAVDSRRCFDNVYRRLKNRVFQLIDQKFGRYEHLKTRMKQLVPELIDEKQRAAWQYIETALKCEALPYTQNSHYYQVTKEKYLAKYRDARAGQISVDDSLPKPRQPEVETILVSDDDDDSEDREDSSSEVADSPTPPPAPASGQKNNKNSATRQIAPLPKRSLAPFEASSPPEPRKLPSKGSRQPPVPSDPPAPPAKKTKLKEGSAAVSASRNPPLTRPPDVLNQFNKRTSALPDAERDELEKEALAALARLGYNVTPADFGKLLPPDLYEQEMDLMAEVRAYFHVAYKRIIDHVPMAIDHTFLFAFADALQGFLIQKLGLGTANGAARCAAYLAEDPHIVAEREELTSKKRRLDGIQAELFNFGLS